MQTFVCTHETSHVGTNMAHRVLNSSTQENVHLIIPRRAGRREDIELVGLTWVCLRLNCCCDSQSSYTYNIWFSSRPRSPVKHSVLCKYNTCYVTNCSTEVGEQQKPIGCPCRKHVGGHTAGVCEHKHMSNAYPSEGCPKSYRPLSISSTNHFVSSTPP